MSNVGELRDLSRIIHGRRKKIDTGIQAMNVLMMKRALNAFCDESPFTQNEY